MVPLLNIIAKQGETTLSTLNFKSPCVDLRKADRGGDSTTKLQQLGSAQAQVESFNAMLDHLHDTGLFDQDLKTGHPVACLEHELARGAPSIDAYMGMLRKRNDSDASICATLSVAHELALFWDDQVLEKTQGHGGTLPKLLRDYLNHGTVIALMHLPLILIL